MFVLRPPNYFQQNVCLRKRSYKTVFDEKMMGLHLDIPKFQYGISGPYWYAGGATIQIILFAILSIMLKTRAPGAKTFLQVRH